MLRRYCAGQFGAGSVPARNWKIHPSAATVLFARRTIILYVSGEESDEQIKMRSDRIEATRELLYPGGNQYQQDSSTHSNWSLTSLLSTRYKLFQPPYRIHASSVSGQGMCREPQRRQGENIPNLPHLHITKDGSIAGLNYLSILLTPFQFEGDEIIPIAYCAPLKSIWQHRMNWASTRMDGTRAFEVANPFEPLLQKTKTSLAAPYRRYDRSGLRPC